MGGRWSGAGGVLSDDEALEFPEATENTERREDMLEERPDSRSLEVCRADLKRVRRKLPPPPESFAVAVIVSAIEGMKD